MLQRKDQVEHNKKKNRILDLTNMTHLLTIILASLLAAEYWLRLMNVKALLHKESLPFRSFKDTRVNEAVDSLEQGFDKVFTRMISQEYYMRVFPDCFDEVIPPLVDRLVMCKHFEKWK